MGRRHAEPIDVRRRDDAPAQFVWRSRLYVVREVLEHWFESGQWWASAKALALGTGSDAAAPVDDLVLSPIPASPKWAQRAWGEPAPDVGAATGPASIDDGEQEFWRVEAVAAPGVVIPRPRCPRCPRCLRRLRGSTTFVSFGRLAAGSWWRCTTDDRS